MITMMTSSILAKVMVVGYMVTLPHRREMERPRDFLNPFRYACIVIRLSNHPTTQTTEPISTLYSSNDAESHTHVPFAKIEEVIIVIIYTKFGEDRFSSLD